MGKKASGLIIFTSQVKFSLKLRISRLLTIHIKNFSQCRWSQRVAVVWVIVLCRVVEKKIQKGVSGARYLKLRVKSILLKKSYIFVHRCVNELNYTNYSYGKIDNAFCRLMKITIIPFSMCSSSCRYDSVFQRQ